MIINGTPGDDVLVGTGDADEFRLRGGGKDDASGKGGDDLFFLGATFDALDTITGGGGYDTLYLEGDYAALLTLGAATMTGIERIQLEAGFDYVLTTDNANVAKGASLNVDASLLQAGQSLVFDGSAEKNGRFDLGDGAGDDVLTAGKGDDYFSMSGGADTVFGNAGDDRVVIFGDFGGEDSLNGGKGDDTFALLGDYSGGLTIKSNMLSKFESLLIDDFAYDLTFLDGVVGAGVQFSIAGNNAQSLTFDGSAETDGSFAFNIIDGDCDLTGGLGDDIFLLAGQRDPKIAAGGDGDDSFVVTNLFAAGDVIDGGAGDDILTLDLALAAGFEITGAMVKGVETLILEGAFAYDLVLRNPVVANNALLTVDATALTAALIFDGSDETNGAFVLTGGAGADDLTGGEGDDTIAGGGGDDVLEGGLGTDMLDGGAGTTVLRYSGVADSTGPGYDQISGFGGAVDQFDLDVTVLGVNKQVKTGALSTATFDADLALAITAAELDADFALVFTASSGTLSGRSFLIVDANGTGGYQAGVDYVIELIGAVQLPALDTGSFI